jgi:hypothetical protein
MDIAYSVHDVPIRLTEERWHHIISARDEMAEYYEDCLNVIENPDVVLKGYRRSLKAVKGYGRRRPDDGFVITAYFVRRIDRRKVIWQP